MNHTDSARLAVARASLRPGWLAARLSIGDVTAALGCSVDSAALVLLCREPRWWRFLADVSTIAQLAEVPVDPLARLLRERRG